jgi:hypothetical protein
MNKPRFLGSLTAIADYLSVSRRTVQRRMCDAGLPVLSQGRNKCSAIPERLDAWLAERNKEAA